MLRKIMSHALSEKALEQVRGALVPKMKHSLAIVVALCTNYGRAEAFAPLPLVSLPISISDHCASRSSETLVGTVDDCYVVINVQIVAATVAEHDKDGDGLLSRSEFKNLLAASSEAQTSISVG